MKRFQGPQFFDFTIQFEASSKAMGVTIVLMQRDQPVEYATKALTKSQMNYPQIEKEASVVSIFRERRQSQSKLTTNR
jgi:hypothetical protein